LAFSPCVKAAESRRGVVGGGLGSPLAGFLPNTEISFLMISPKLLDICPVSLLVFSPLETADLLILFYPSGDGYSLLCSQKSSFRGTVWMPPKAGMLAKTVKLPTAAETIGTSQRQHQKGDP
jgi:hypothetical protein